MTNEKISSALDCIDDTYIESYFNMKAKAEEKPTLKQSITRYGAIAACLALMIGLGAALAPMIANINAPEDTRNVVKNFGSSDGVTNADYVYDQYSIQGAVEIADLIVVATVEETLDITVPEDALLPMFTYSISVSDVIYDRVGRFPDRASKAEPISFRISNGGGYMKATEYQEAVKWSPEAGKFGIKNKVYGEDDYFAFYAPEGAIFEEGKTYVIFLDDEHYSQIGTYSIASYTQAYELDGRNLKLLFGDEKAVSTLKQLKKEIAEAVKNRTGELDNGMKAYQEAKRAERNAE